IWAGFVVPEDGGADLFIPADGLGSAVNGDRVVARIEKKRRGQRREGRVIRVLERARQTIVGTYHPARNFGFVTPEDRKLTRDVFVPPGLEKDASEGDLVVVRVTNWGDGHLGPGGGVEGGRGAAGRPGGDVLGVIDGHELPVAFPPEVAAEAEALRDRGITAAALGGRLGLRDELIFTIDPADAKDHVGALSVKRI